MTIQYQYLSMTIQYHSDSRSISLPLCSFSTSSNSHGKYKCVLSHPIPWDVSHGIPIGMTFLLTSLPFTVHADNACSQWYWKLRQNKLIISGRGSGQTCNKTF